MTPHYTQKRRKDGSINRIAYYRCTKSIHHDKNACTIRHVNAEKIENTVIKCLQELCQNREFVDRTVSDLNQDQKRKVKPLFGEIQKLKRRLTELDAEIDLYVKALGKGRLSIDRLEREIEAREKDRETLLDRISTLERDIQECEVRDFDAHLVRKGLREFRACFSSLTPQEQAETLQTVLKAVEVSSEGLTLEVFELPEVVLLGSKNRKEWLLGLDSNQQPFG